MTKIAAMQMYDFPEIREATGRFWRLIRSGLEISGIASPLQLAQNRHAPDIWQDPEMVLSQTCGLPYIRGRTGQSVLLGTPDYGVVPALPGHYFSVVIVSKNDSRYGLSEMQNSTFAYNDIGSQSGVFAMFDLLFEHSGDTRFFNKCVASGGHVTSFEMVVSGQADIAAIDAVTWRYLCKFHQDARHVRVLAPTRPAPGLPYITGKNQNPEAVTNAVEHAITALSEKDQKALGIVGFWRSKPRDYQVLAQRAARVSGLIKKHGLGE